MGIVDVQAKNVCDQEGRRRFVFVESEDGNLVADMRQYANHARKNGIGRPGAPIDHRVREHEAEGAVGDHGANAKKLTSLQEVVVLDWTTPPRWMKLSFSNGGGLEGKKEDNCRGVEGLGCCQR